MVRDNPSFESFSTSMGFRCAANPSYKTTKLFPKLNRGTQDWPGANEIPRENRDAVMALAHGVTIMSTDPLVRSSSDRMFAGVCGGLSKWLDWDSTALHIVVALTAFFTGVVPGLVIYVILAVIMPAENSTA